MHTEPPMHSPRATVPLYGIDPSLPAGRLSFDRVLFLDFDGVMHPDVADPGLYFCFVPEFCTTVRAADPCGELPIVVSSAWRTDCSIAAMRKHFPTDIARQLVGVTPDLQDPRGTHPGPWGLRDGALTPSGSRQREVLAWMDTYAPAGQWLAIDDKESIFEQNCPHLFRVPGLYEADGGGLTRLVAAALLVRLAEFLG